MMSPQTTTHFGDSAMRRNRSAYLVGLIVLFVVGFIAAILSGASNQIVMQASHVIARTGLLEALCLGIVGLLVVYLLVRFAEIALALFFLVGFVKGDPALASAPVDLTVVTAATILIAVLFRVFVKNQTLRLPREYIFYVPLLAMMIVSLTYTPDFGSGLDEILRFLCLTSIGIVAPFVLFDEDRKINRFFLALASGGLLLAINSFAGLGGENRMVTPSGLTTELGGACAVSIVVIWAMLFPRMRFLARLPFYPALAVLAIGLIGSGGRFANVGTVVCIILGTLICRKLFIDLLAAGGLTVVALSMVWIPESSFNYLHSLIHPTQAMGTRSDLMALGIRLFTQHPFLGVGVNGYRFVSPNPLTYNFPHNIFLELGSEMGIVAVIAFAMLAFYSFREIIRQMSISHFRDNPLVPTVFLLLIYVFLDSMESGDINDLRFMWCIFGLPFVLRALRSTSVELEVSHDVILLPQSATAHLAEDTGNFSAASASLRR